MQEWPHLACQFGGKPVTAGWLQRGHSPQQLPGCKDELRGNPIHIRCGSPMGKCWWHQDEGHCVGSRCALTDNNGARQNVADSLALGMKQADQHGHHTTGEPEFHDPHQCSDQGVAESNRPPVIADHAQTHDQSTKFRRWAVALIRAAEPIATSAVELRVSAATRFDCARRGQSAGENNRGSTR